MLIAGSGRAGEGGDAYPMRSTHCRQRAVEWSRCRCAGRGRPLTRLIVLAACVYLCRPSSCFQLRFLFLLCERPRPYAPGQVLPERMPIQILFPRAQLVLRPSALHVKQRLLTPTRPRPAHARACTAPQRSAKPSRSLYEHTPLRSVLAVGLRTQCWLAGRGTQRRIVGSQRTEVEGR